MLSPRSARRAFPCSASGPAVDVLASELGLAHALASRRLYTDGAEVLYDYARHAGDTPEGDSARELVVVRNGQRVFTEVVDQYLRRVDFASDGYAQLIRLPQYRVAEVTVDPDHAFGRPRLTHGGAKVDDVIDLFLAGEPVDAVAGEFGLTRDEVEDVLRVSANMSAHRDQPLTGGDGGASAGARYAAMARNICSLEFE
jgi:uncharacterized protein (DUF433 family)